MAPRGSDGRGAGRGGFTLVEILVALSILFTLIAFFLVAMRGRETEGRKSSRYFNAVMLAQKIADDLDHRVRENPHAIERLAALPAEGRAVEGESPLFRFLEDTTADGTLGNDAPITAAAGSIHEQFKDYRFRVTFERGVRNGLSRARILVRWDDRGRTRSYEISQLLPDLPSRVETGEPADFEVPVDDEGIRAALFNEPGPLDDLLARYRIGRDLAADLARIRVGCRSAAVKLAECARRDETLERSASAGAAATLAARASLREENAVAIVQFHRALARPFAAVDARLSAGTFDPGDLFSNSCAVGLVKDLAVAARGIGGRANRDCLALRFNLELAEAIGHHLRVATDAGAAAKLPWSARTAALMRIVELGSVLAQNNGDRLVLAAGSFRIPAIRLVENVFKSLAALLSGRDYNKADYVEEKLKSVRHRRFAEFEDVSDRVRLMAGVSAAASRLLERLLAL